GQWPPGRARSARGLVLPDRSETGDDRGCGEIPQLRGGRPEFPGGLLRMGAPPLDGPRRRGPATPLLRVVVDHREPPAGALSRYLAALDGRGVVSPLCLGAAPPPPFLDAQRGLLRDPVDAHLADRRRPRRRDGVAPTGRLEGSAGPLGPRPPDRCGEPLV